LASLSSGTDLHLDFSIFRNQRQHRQQTHQRPGIRQDVSADTSSPTIYTFPRLSTIRIRHLYMFLEHVFSRSSWIFLDVKEFQTQLLMDCNQIGSTSPPRSAWRPPSSDAVNARSGSTQMRSARSQTPTPVKPSASSLPMVSSSASQSPCTLDPAPVSSLLPDELVDTVVSVRERVLLMLVCQGMHNHVGSRGR